MSFHSLYGVNVPLFSKIEYRISKIVKKFAYVNFFYYLCTRKSLELMENNSIEMALLEPEERELVEFVFKAIPAADRGGLTPDDILLVLDLMDDYLEEQGLLREDPQTGEMEYLEGEVDETEQLNYVLEAASEEGRPITSVHVQLIQDAELQYGIEHGYYEEN